MFAHRGSLMLESIKENIEAIGAACVMFLCSPRTCLISTIDGEKLCGAGTRILSSSCTIHHFHHLPNSNHLEQILPTILLNHII
jgi:hypothetical protein